MKIFDNHFDNVLMDCNYVYLMHKGYKGETWKKLSLYRLRGLVLKEIDEYITENKLENQYKELLDLINVCLMLATRIRPKSEFEIGMSKLIDRYKKEKCSYI